jgi:AraC-like DNA-binding protein
MRRASTASDFLADPIGRYCAGRRYCVFAHSPTLLGLASWGRPDVEDVTELLQLCEIGLRPGVVPHRFLVDVRELELVMPATFGLFLEYTRKNGRALARNIVRQAQLRPEGLVGAIISGFSRIARLPYPERVFGDVEEALGWLEVERQEGLDLLAELDAIRNAACQSDAIVARVRAQLEASGAIGIDEVARLLGLSTRTLQRGLRQAGTSYRMQVQAFQIRRAQELLRTGEQNLAWIAAEVGFSSAQHFATAYRRAIGDTPTAWRSRHRALDP